MQVVAREEAAAAAATERAALQASLEARAAGEVAAQKEKTSSAITRGFQSQVCTHSERSLSLSLFPSGPDLTLISPLDLILISS